MFSEVPDLLDRDFAVGYVLPAVMLVAANAGLAAVFNLWPAFPSTFKANTLLASTAVVVAVWLLATVLMVANRPILRLLEGYVEHTPPRLFAKRELARFERSRAAAAAAPDDHAWLHAQQFPARREWVLPTAFGNAIRAFETYSFEMYGADAVVLWSRLLAVIPTHYRELINSAKADLDFWVNTWVLAPVVIAEAVVFALATHRFLGLWVVLPALAAVFLARYFALEAAIDWGDVVKAAFDVYLPQLGALLAFPPEADRARAFAWWEQYSDALNRADRQGLPGAADPANDQPAPQPEQAH